MCTQQVAQSKCTIKFHINSYQVFPTPQVMSSSVSVDYIALVSIMTFLSSFKVLAYKPDNLG